MITDERIMQLNAMVDYHAIPLARAIEAEVHAELRKQEPYAFVTGGDCHADGSIDCKAWATGEFTKPLYAAPIPTPSQQEALDAFERCLYHGHPEEFDSIVRHFILARPDAPIPPTEQALDTLGTEKVRQKAIELTRAQLSSIDMSHSSAPIPPTVRSFDDWLKIYGHINITAGEINAAKDAFDFAIYAAPIPPIPTPSQQEAYNELIYAVERKFPDETRHQTALRYIRHAESRARESAQCSAARPDEGSKP